MDVGTATVDICTSPEQRRRIPTDHSGSDSDDLSRPAPSHCLWPFFSLDQLQRAPQEIKKLRKLIDYLIRTEGSDMMALPEPESERVNNRYSSIHIRKFEARSTILCELRELENTLEKLFPS